MHGPPREGAWKQFLPPIPSLFSLGPGIPGPPLLEKLFSQSRLFLGEQGQHWIEGGRKRTSRPLVREDLKGLALKLLDHLKGLDGSSGPELGKPGTLEELKQEPGELSPKN